MRALALLLAAALPAAPVVAGELVEDAAAVEAAVAAGDFAAWQAAYARLAARAWFSAGLHFDALALTAEPAAGYGLYDPRPGNAYARGEPVHLYAEPEGFGYGAAGEGRLRVALDIDLTIRDAAGAVVAERPKFHALQGEYRGPVREVMAALTVPTGDLSPGRYALEFTFHDLHGGQSAAFTSEIEIE